MSTSYYQLIAFNSLASFTCFSSITVRKHGGRCVAASLISERVGVWRGCVSSWVSLRSVLVIMFIRTLSELLFEHLDISLKRMMCYFYRFTRHCVFNNRKCSNYLTSDCETASLELRLLQIAVKCICRAEACGISPSGAGCQIPFVRTRYSDVRAAGGTPAQTWTPWHACARCLACIYIQLADKPDAEFPSKPRASCICVCPGCNKAEVCEIINHQIFQ